MSATVHYKDIRKGMEKDLESLFKKYDSDRNGKITYIEIVETLRKAGKKNPERIADLLFRDDTDKNGELTIEEAKLRIVRMNDEKIEKVLNWDVEKFINDNDKDGDRKITRDEVLQRFTEQGAEDPELITDSIFRQMDLDRDGVITCDEIKEFNRKKKFSFLKSSAPKQ